MSSETSEKRPDDADRIREMVSEGYARVVETHGEDAGDAVSARAQSSRLGYTDEQLDAVPDGANLGVGCGNPTAIDRLKPGETVVDLGSGAGFDALLAAREVGPTGRVIGVDMTEAMLDKARENAAKLGLDHVEFRKGQIEDLPIESESVDVIISNCVVNLSPEKERVYAEAYRVLKPGGRLMISDVVLARPLPREILDGIDAYLGCIGGASVRAEYLDTIAKAGFSEVRVDKETSFVDSFDFDDPGMRALMDRMGVSIEQAREYASSILSLHIFARR